jgi:peptide methionine sulfoxide reductase msrA/msrB
MNVESFPAATFAGGCFWCLEADLLHLPGVLSATSGYTGGSVEHPTYEDVCGGETGHYEAVQARFDPELVSYRALADWFLRRIDPTNAGGQFCDHGPQYRTALFYADADQKREAEAAVQALADLRLLPKPVATEVLPAAPFYPAEDYHQDYGAKNPRRYQLYRMGCGRDATLARLWGKEAADPLFGYVPRLARGPRPEAELRRLLSPQAYHVVREDGTEPPFQNAYFDEHRPGIYVDAVSGAPLFSSRHKFDSGTGWPSFTRPLMPGNILTRTDRKLLMPRTEVLAWHSGSHLGHVFEDGPREAGGLRYCMNSAALRFIPLEELAAAGYGRYAGLFTAP